MSINKKAEVPHFDFTSKPATPPAPMGGMPTIPNSPALGNQWTGAAKAIATMQQAIHKLIDSVFNSKDETLALQKNQFNNFLANQYEAPSSPDVQPWQQATLSNALTALKKFSIKGSMHNGVWDVKTQQALQNIFAFASAFLKMSQDFGGVPHGLSFLFQESDLADLYEISQIIGKGANPDILLDKAHHATDVINKLNNFYNYYYQSITKNPNYRTHIVNNQPLYVVKPDVSDEEALLSKPQDLAHMVLRNVVVPAKNINNKDPRITPTGLLKLPTLGLLALKDENIFKSFIKSSLGYTDEDLQKDPSIITQVLAAIKLNIQQNTAQG